MMKQKKFLNIWNQTPMRFENNIRIFGKENDGDYFSDEDVRRWQNKYFQENFYTDKLLLNKASRKLLDEITKNKEAYIDLACGPGMGLIPSIKQLSSSISCLAADANLTLLNEWKKWLNDRQTGEDIDFAQFSLFDIPIEDSTVKACGGFLCLSSTRFGNKEFDTALSEIYRILVPKGRLYVIENEWLNVPSILDVFEKSNIQPWTCFLEEQISWQQRFLDKGFEILSKEPYMTRILRGENNELGKATEQLGKKIEMQWNAFILEKI